MAYLSTIISTIYISCLASVTLAFSQDASIEQPLHIPYSNQEITIDGDLEDWDKYLLRTFSDTMTMLHTPAEFPFALDYEEFDYESNIEFPKSRNEVKAYLSWDLNYLYVGFDVADRHLFAEYPDASESPDIFYNDGVEIYIDAANDSRGRLDLNDYQFMIDVLNNNTVFKGDRQQMNEGEKYAVPKDFGQNVLFTSAVKIKGTLNDSTVQSSGYIVEVKIPFAAIGFVPEPGKKFKMDLCNNDVDYFLNEVTYYLDKPIITWPFNWGGWNNYGFPDYWITVQLDGEPTWFEAISYHARQRWIRFIGILVILTLMVYVFLLFRIRKLRRLPARTEVEPATILVVKGEAEPDIQLSENQLLLQNATDFISENRSEALSSEKVADHLSISLRKFQRITKEEMQCTPTNFIYIVKLNLAADYLKSKKGNVSETAYEFGFSDPSYFSKLFKKHFGVAPASYMENNDKRM